MHEPTSEQYPSVSTCLTRYKPYRISLFINFQWIRSVTFLQKTPNFNPKTLTLTSSSINGDRDLSNPPSVLSPLRFLDRTRETTESATGAANSAARSSLYSPRTPRSSAQPTRSPHRVPIEVRLRPRIISFHETRPLDPIALLDRSRQAEAFVLGKVRFFRRRPPRIGTVVRRHATVRRRLRRCQVLRRRRSTWRHLRAFFCRRGRPRDSRRLGLPGDCDPLVSLGF